MTDKNLSRRQKPSSCAILKRVADLYAQGCSDARIACELGLSFKEIAQRIKDGDIELQKAISLGKLAARAYWEEKIHTEMSSEEIKRWQLVMQYRYGASFADMSAVLLHEDSSQATLQKILQEVFDGNLTLENAIMSLNVLVKEKQLARDDNNSANTESILEQAANKGIISVI